MQARSISLGDVSGVAYYVVEEDGYRVVATLAAGEGVMPIRFVTTPVSGQRMTMSAPQAAGRGSMNVEFVRAGDNIIVSDASAAMN